ncbi:54S ribosomal protein L10 mitochondrial [Heracleum sosnowskyi]|uniref:54S ribosomal protein L10 mitochondrial n=1 Tax=Heracleum sosnowskyi TaxID=360622 RepID=A0AAD8JIN6_9APIA|nr:54S ribosomal protein L10 mitochondrial [Heracleum sosnowskyi]
MLRRQVTSLLSICRQNVTQYKNIPQYLHNPTISTLIPHSFPQKSPLEFLKNPSPKIGFLGTRAYSLLSLNDLRDNKGARKQKTRKGRGIGSGKGKTAGRGHKGQKARGTHKFGFEGGQTPLRRRLPKRGFHNPFSLTFQPVGLGKIAKLINAGKIDSSELITMKTLKEAGAIGKQIRDGVRLMGRGAEHIQWPIHLEVTRVTVRAKAAVEAAGGSVRKVYYNKLGFRALLKPEWFEKKGRLLPRAARPPPKQADKVDSIGRLPAPTKPIPFTAEEREAMSTPAV